MIHTLEVSHLDTAIWNLLRYMNEKGGKEESRNGPVLALNAPLVTTVFPSSSVVSTSAVRDANPFFHVMEALWILAKRSDVSFVANFNSKIGTYSDDGLTFNGAYGARIGYQLDECISQLLLEPTSRRNVLQMWLPGDLASKSKDVPCNTQVLVRAMSDPDGKWVIHLTVNNRSNDVVWGLLGANIVQFRFLLDYLALATGYRRGYVWHVSNNAHLYLEKHQELMDYAVANECHSFCLPQVYEPVTRLCAEGQEGVPERVRFAEDLRNLDVLLDPLNDRRTPFFRSWFFRNVAEPMAIAWHLYKEGSPQAGVMELSQRRGDWCGAGVNWLRRRVKT